jgi:hypothetical protein
LRKITVAAMAVPVLARLYVPVLVRRTLAGRTGVGMGLVAIAGILMFGLAAPGATTARPPVSVVTVGEASFIERIESDHPLREPIVLTFSEPMDATTSANAITVRPQTPLDLAWDAAGKALSISTAAGWQPGTYYAITIGTGALDRSGRNLAAPKRASFTTRAPIGGRIDASAAALNGALPTSSSFTVAYSGPVNVAEAEVALRIVPAVQGTVQTGVTGTGGTLLTFVPAGPLAANTDYSISIDGVVRDLDGAEAATPSQLAVHTVTGASVVRFRPRNGTSDVQRTSALSVRFTAPMDHASTAAAFTARVGTTKLKGRITWAEGDTVLVFEPASALGYGAKVVMQVAGTARDVLGTPIATARPVTFAAEKKPAPAKPVAKQTVRRSSGTPASATTHIATGGSVVGSDSWHAVELYYLKLMNCTRGGGWVTSGGDCSSPGGSGLAPLILSPGISDRVSRPYAKLLTANGICSHFVGGNPGDRLRAEGYGGDYRENLGCLGGNPYASALSTHLFFQSEKPCGGYCHYANIMAKTMKYVGIGLWIADGRLRLVIDFSEG